jgi:TonB-dependent SusC/RagA subfamily outer membrane receptor
LKDASDTSVYGSRAANGVIYITTKRGQRDADATITLNAQYGISQPATHKFHLMSGSELADYQYKHGYLTASEHKEIIDSGVNTNWRDYLFNQAAPMYQVDLSVSGGSKKSSYYISGMFMDQDGTDPASGVHKYAIRANIDAQAKDWVKFGMNLGLGSDKRQLANSTQGYLNYMADNVAFGAIMFPTYISPYEYNEATGKYDGPEVERLPILGTVNPLLKNKYYKYIQRTTQFNATGYALITPFKNFNIKTQVRVTCTMQTLRISVFLLILTVLVQVMLTVATLTTTLSLTPTQWITSGL